MLTLFSFFLISLPNQIQASNEATHTICQFYLNKAKGQENDRGMNRIFKTRGVNVNIKTFYSESGEFGKESFEKMIETQTKCDGLVISGHHAGDFMDAKKRVFLKDIEKFSCNEKYKDWFKNIKSLWLLGCNTAADKELKPIREKKPTDRQLRHHPDASTTRLINSGYNPDHASLYQHSYSGSINELTPLSSRYLRMFPNTNIYGFLGAAPKNEDWSDRSIIFEHIGHLGEALDMENKKDKKDNKFTKDEIISGLNMLLKNTDHCDERLDTWENSHGRGKNFQAIDKKDYEDVYKFGCDLIKAKQTLENSKSTPKEKASARKKILDTLKNMMKEDAKIADGEDKYNDIKYSHLLFNNIYETWAFAGEKDEKLHTGLKKIFKGKTFSKVLEERIESPTVASLKQIDYLNFYKEIHNLDIHNNKGRQEKVKFIQDKISSILDKKLKVNFNYLKNSRTGGSFSEKSKSMLSLLTIDQLSQYNLLTKKQAKDLLKNTKIFPPIQHTQSKPTGKINTYSLQVKYRLTHLLSNPKEVINKVAEDLKTDMSYPEKSIPITLAARELVQSKDVKNLNTLAEALDSRVKTLHSQKQVKASDLQEENKLRRDLIRDLVNEIILSIRREHSDQPKEQVEVFASYMNENYPSLHSYTLMAAEKLSKQTQKLFLEKVHKQEIVIHKNEFNTSLLNKMRANVR